MKDFADDNFNFDENGRQLSKWVENTVGKGEIARYEQFLLFPQCFQKACFQGASKGVIVWEWVNSSSNSKILDTAKLKALYNQRVNLEINISVFDRVKNIVEKGENTDYQHFFSHSVFKKLVSQGRQKVSLRGNGLN